MTTKYNQKFTANATSTRETWEEVGNMADGQPTGLDPAKTYQIEELTDREDTGEGTIQVTVTRNWVEVPAETTPGIGGREPDGRTDSVSPQLSFGVQYLDIEQFGPMNAIDFFTEGGNADFLSGKIVKAQTGGGWEYPAGVYGILPKPATVDPDVVQYKAYRDAGIKVRAMVPSASVTITVWDTYEGTADGWDGIPQSIHDLAQNPDTYKPTVGAGVAQARFLNTDIPVTIDYQFTGGSVSGNIVINRISKGGVEKQRVQYQVTKSWAGIVKADTTRLWQ